MTDRTKTICPPIFDLGGIKSMHDEIILIEIKRHDNIVSVNKCDYFKVEFSVLTIK